ncbi:RsmB/NOP family class I SAM-dependent RNA methyltransferase [Magnetofaba australis]|uniref:Putative Fmu (Sun) domain-containing protein n=1 Tax=Magnetofaba australis IT-1 TaxID=1434232 RepID=A0A1Y2K153_9PROT|nr:RsmB/NOP family class I SAM-dependent RNA methyltransferase [Magnetofaba australis]OSM00021.1 putative Fmu (Sun) domain-containing protein [Magnetofaba australis IT-1]
MRSDPPLAAELAAHLLRQRDQGAEGLLRRFFRQYPKLGKRDRARIGDLSYFVLRHLRLLGWAEDPATPLENWIEQADLTPLAQRAQTWLAEGAPPPDPALTTAQRLSLPDWLCDALLAERDEAELTALMAALQQPAPVDLRVNRLRTSPTKLQARLARDGVETTPLPGIADGLRLTARRNLRNDSAFADGLYEIQDAGSQLIAPLCGAQAGQTIIDLCAGGGGKALHLAALMGDQGKIIACDVHAHRLDRMRPRLKRAGARSVEIQPLTGGDDDPALTPWRQQADAVLVDAPCSGLGTLRRQPHLTWRLRAEEITRLAALQTQLLARAAQLVKPGGRLVYATCSLLAAENQAQARAFDAAHPDWTPLPTQDLLRHAGMTPPGLWREESVDPWLRAAPQDQSSDGFFAAVWQRSE